MRYYYYGNISAKDRKINAGLYKDLNSDGEKIFTNTLTRDSYEKNTDTFQESEKKQYDGLVIEEDTIYEIDEECMKCRKAKTGIFL